MSIFIPHTNEEERATFLAHLAAGAKVKDAAKAAGVDHSHFYRDSHHDLDFLEMWERARASGIRARLHVVEDALLESATLGKPREIYDKRTGDLLAVAHERDTIAGIFLAKRGDPAYSDRYKIDVDSRIEAAPLPVATQVEALFRTAGSAAMELLRLAQNAAFELSGAQLASGQQVIEAEGVREIDPIDIAAPSSI